jgi:putative flippase GtrA
MYKKSVNRTFLKFIIVGLGNTLFGMTIMFVLYNFFGCGYWLSSTTNYIFGSILSFFLNKYFTFRVKYLSAQMVLAFVANISGCYLIAYGMAKPLIEFLLQNYNEKITGNISLLAGMCLFVMLNYLGQKFLVFKIKERI